MLQRWLSARTLPGLTKVHASGSTHFITQQAGPGTAAPEAAAVVAQVVRLGGGQAL
jgi:hypothetical protein